jgi:hypothetical protein
VFCRNFFLICIGDKQIEGGSRFVFFTDIFTAFLFAVFIGFPESFGKLFFRHQVKDEPNLQLFLTAEIDFLFDETQVVSS